MNILSGDTHHAWRGQDIIDWCLIYCEQTKDKTKAFAARHILNHYKIVPDRFYYVYSYTFYHTHKRFMLVNAEKSCMGK